MEIKIIIGILLALLLIPAGSMAETTTIPNVNYYDVSVIDGMVIDQITIDNVPVGTNQTHTLYSGGESLTLEVNSIADDFAGVNYHSTFQLKLSNGTASEELTMDKYSTSQDYKLYIQMLDPLEPGGMTNLLSVNLYLGLKPLTARFDLPSNFGSYLEIPMTRVTGNTGAYTTVYVTQDTFEAWQSLTSGSISHYVEEATGLVIGAVLAAIALIPFVGPYFVSFLSFTGSFLSEGTFWITYVLINFIGLFFAAEAFIMMIACTNGRFNPAQTVGLIIKYNADAIDFLRRSYETLHNLITKIIEAIGALK